MKTVFLLSLFLVFLFLLSSCSARQISGEVFVVGKSGSRLKQALVDVSIVPETSMKANLVTLRPQCDAIKNQEIYCHERFISDVADCDCSWWAATADIASLYFTNLPADAKSTRTDEEGKFRFTIDKPGRYALMARTVAEDRKYYWIIWVAFAILQPPRTRTRMHSPLLT